MRKILSETEAKKIEDCVAAVEAKANAEVVPVVVSASDDYPAAGWRMGAGFAFVAGIALAYYRPHLDPLWFFLAASIFFLAGILAAEIPVIRRFALRDYKVGEEVHQRAIQAFHESGVHRTKLRTGILIFVSLLEHRAEILCDIGIAEKVAPGEWKRIVDKLALEVKRGRLADGVCEAIQESGALVATHFPPTPGDQDELSNRPVHSR